MPTLRAALRTGAVRRSQPSFQPRRPLRLERPVALDPWVTPHCLGQVAKQVRRGDLVLRAVARRRRRRRARRGVGGGAARQRVGPRTQLHGLRRGRAGAARRGRLGCGCRTVGLQGGADAGAWRDRVSANG